VRPAVLAAHPGGPTGFALATAMVVCTMLARRSSNRGWLGLVLVGALLLGLAADILATAPPR